MTKATQPIYRNPPTLCKPESLGGVWTNTVELPAQGRLLFISGLTARDKDCRVLHEGDVGAQTRSICENLGIALESSNGRLDDVVKVTVYVMDRSHFRDIHAVRAEFWPENPPASSLVQVAGLVDPRCLIEIDATAWLPGDP